MKVTYDPKADTLSVAFGEGASIAESDEDKPGMILDYDAEGNLISLEILDASIRVSDTRKIEFEMTARTGGRRAFPGGHNEVCHLSEWRNH